MSGGFGSDAITTELPVAGEAELITRNMPGDDGALVINTATSGTVLLGTSSSINPNTAVPLPAGASVQWVDDGELWAYLGPDGTTPVTLVVTDRASSWQPSPEAVGLAVASEILATGVPNVITQDVLASNQNMPANGSNLSFDVSKYASLAIQVEPNSSFGDLTQLGIGLSLNTEGAFLLTESVSYQFNGVLDCGDSTTLIVTNSAAGLPAVLTIVGSNRQTGHRFDGRVTSSTPLNLASATTNFQYSAAGANDVKVGDTITFQGQAFAHFYVIGAITGYFYVKVGGIAVPLLDSSELATWSSGIKHLTRMIALPASTPSSIWFRPFNSGAVVGSAGVDLIPALI